MSTVAFMKLSVLKVTSRAVPRQAEDPDEFEKLLAEESAATVDATAEQT